MSEPAGVTGRDITARVVTHLRTPLYRNSYALVVSAAGTAVLGLLYWTVAARKYAAHEVGVQSVVISTLLFLAGLAQLSLNSVLIRFVPVAGSRSGRIIAVGYAVSAAAAIAIATVFVIGTPFWSPTLTFLRSEHSVVRRVRARHLGLVRVRPPGQRPDRSSASDMGSDREHLRQLREDRPPPALRTRSCRMPACSRRG